MISRASRAPEALLDELLELRRETALLRDSCRRVGNSQEAARATLALGRIDRQLRKLQQPPTRGWLWLRALLLGLLLAILLHLLIR